MYCKKCGSQIKIGSNFCSKCGTPVSYQDTNDDNYSNCHSDTYQFNQNDVIENKFIAAVSYLGIFFFIPLIARPNSKFCRFHANQGLIFFIACICIQLVFKILSAIIGSILSIILSFSFPYFIFDIISVIMSIIPSVIIITLFILGLINSLTGKLKELPVIGRFRIIK